MGTSNFLKRVIQFGWVHFVVVPAIAYDPYECLDVATRISTFATVQTPKWGPPVVHATIPSQNTCRYISKPDIMEVTDELIISETLVQQLADGKHKVDGKIRNFGALTKYLKEFKKLYCTYPANPIYTFDKCPRGMTRLEDFGGTQLATEKQKSIH